MCKRLALCVLLSLPVLAARAEGPALSKRFTLWEDGADRVAIRSDEVSVVRPDGTGAGYHRTAEGWWDAKAPIPYSRSRWPVCDTTNSWDDRSQRAVVAAIPAGRRIKNVTKLPGGRVLAVYSTVPPQDGAYDVFAALLTRSDNGKLVLASELEVSSGHYCETRLLEGDLPVVVVWEEPASSEGVSVTAITIED